MNKGRFVHEYDVGEDIFHPGDCGDEAFVIERGRVRVWTLPATGQTRQPLAILGPGEVLGEMALISQRPRVAGASAIDAACLRVVTREGLAQRLREADPLLRHVLNGVMSRLHAMVDDAPTMATHPAVASGPAAVGLAALKSLQLEHAIAEGLEHGQFELHFQPIVRLADGQRVGFEALSRWRRDGALVSPGVFIPVTERSALALEFTRWVALTTCAALPRLVGSCPLTYVSINIPARQFDDLRSLDGFAQALDVAGMTPARLRLEVTETQLLSDWNRARAWLDRARALGFGVMLDDFGTGYSSLAYLHRLPLTALKIDRSFVSSMLDDRDSRRILKTISTLARDLGIDCVAEGIEQPDQASALLDIGVSYGQGFLFGRPEPL